MGADMFSVGILLWEMLVKRVPHSHLSFGQVLASVGWAALVPDMSLLPPVPSELKHLVMACLRFMPTERPCSADVEKRLRRLPRKACLTALRMLHAFLMC